MTLIFLNNKTNLYDVMQCITCNNMFNFIETATLYMLWRYVEDQ